MATDAKTTTTDAGAYDFTGRYRFAGGSVDGPDHGTAEVAERACNDQDVLAFIARNWRPAASATALYAQYLLREDARGQHRRLLELIPGNASPAPDPCGA